MSRLFPSSGTSEPIPSGGLAPGPDGAAAALAAAAIGGSPGGSAGSGVLSTLASNPVFAGGVGLASLGGALAVARRAVIGAAQLARRQLLVSVEVSRRDPAYPWLLAWLSQASAETASGAAGAGGWLARRLTRVRNLSATTTVSVDGRGGGDETGASGANGEGAGGGNMKAHFLLAHGYGRHLVRHEGTYIAVNREKTSTANLTTGEPHEVLTLTLLHSQRGAIESVFRAAHALAASSRSGRTVVYSARGTEWAPLGQPRMLRPLSSVVLAPGIKERLVADVDEFLKAKEWYRRRGVPYRRGYLLHGPPGTGKTSFVLALAAHLGYGVAIVNLAEHGLTDDRLAHLLTRLPPRTIGLLEDCDAAFGNRRVGNAATDADNATGSLGGPGGRAYNAARDVDGYTGATVTMSGLLNALDGAAAGEDRITILTTNYPSRLSPALARPGRVDLAVRIGEATREQAAQLWDNFYGELDTDGTMRQRFLERLDELRLFEGGRWDGDGVIVGEEKEDWETPVGTKKRYTSTAAIQGLFLFNKNDMEGAIRDAELHLVPRGL